MILSRYVLREHAGPFWFAFSVIMFLLVIDLMLQMLDRLLGKGIDPGVVLELFLLNTAWMVALAVPMAVLVATLLAFGRLSADGEMTAMCALGVGIHQVMAPVLLAGAMLGGGMVWFNDRVLPEFNHRARMLMMDIQRKRPAVAIADKAGIVIGEFPGYQLLFSHADPRTGMLRDVVVYHDEGIAYPTTIAADSGQVGFDTARDEVLLWLFGGEIHRIDMRDVPVYVTTSFERARLRLGEAGQRLARSVSSYRNDREMGIGMMRAQISDFEREIVAMQVESGARIGDFFAQVLLLPEVPEQPEMALRTVMGRTQADARLLYHRRLSAARLRVEVHKKFSIPAACIAFVLVGVPLGIRARGKSPAVGAGISIGFFLVWWIFLIGGEKLADRGGVAPWLAMWCPNIATVLIGAWLAFRGISARRIRRPPCA